MANIRNLAFSGNGAITLAFTGALIELENEPGFAFKNLQRAIGDSMGALVAFMVCARFSITEIASHLKKIISQIASAKHPVDFDGSALPATYDAEVLRACLRELLAAKGLTEETTFGHFKEQGFLDLYITTTKFFKNNGFVYGKPQTFSHEEDYNTAIFPILLASISTPIHFPPVKLKCLSIDGHPEDKEHSIKNAYVEDLRGFTYINGGHSNNFPETYFDQPKYVSESPKSGNEIKKIFNLETLGFRLCIQDETTDPQNKSEEEKEELVSDADFLAHYADVATSAVSANLTRHFMENAETNRTVFIEIKNIKPSEWVIQKEEEESLHQSGVEGYRRLRQALINFGSKFTPSTQISRRVASSALPSQYTAHTMFRQASKVTVETETKIAAPEITKGSCCTIS